MDLRLQDGFERRPTSFVRHFAESTAAPPIGAALAMT
jgi:hypothetical protein